LSESFWLSEKGILIRLEDLAGDFTFRVYNNALKGNFKEAGFTKFVWVAVEDDKICGKCLARSGKVYRSGQFMPNIPAHPHCRCLFDIEVTL